MKRNLWLARALFGATLLIATSCWALDLGSLFGSGGDSGSGKVAHLEFRLKDGFAATSIAWSPGGKYIATSGTQTRLIHIWDVEQRKLVKELELPHPPAGLSHNMSWSPDGRYLATCNSYDSSLRIYDAQNWTVAKDFGRAEAIACQKPVFSDDGQELAAWAGDLVTWDVNGWKEKRRLKGVFDDGRYAQPLRNAWNSNLSIRDISYVSGTHVLALGGGRYEHSAVDACGATPPVYTNRIWVLEPEDKELTRSLVILCLPTPGGDTTHVVTSPAGSQIVAASLEAVNVNTVRVLERSTGKQLGMPLQDHPQDRPYGLSYTPDGRFLLIGGSHDFREPSPIYIVDAKTLKVLDVVHVTASIHDLTVNPRGGMFAVSSFDGFTVWKFINQ